MKRLNLVLMFLLFVAEGNAQKLMGFTDANAAKQIDWEKQFDTQLNAQNMELLAALFILIRKIVLYHVFNLCLYRNGLDRFYQEFPELVH